MAPAASQSAGKRVAAPPKNHQRRPLSQQNVSLPSLDVSRSRGEIADQVGNDRKRHGWQCRGLFLGSTSRELQYYYCSNADDNPDDAGNYHRADGAAGCFCSLLKGLGAPGPNLYQ